jgi:hypothetical protein
VSELKQQLATARDELADAVSRWALYVQFTVMISAVVGAFAAAFWLAVAGAKGDALLC